MASGTEQGVLWGTHAEDWANFSEPLTRPVAQAMVEASSVGPGMTLLDIGCGAGGLCVLAAEKGAKVTGIDAAEALLGVARRRVPNGEFHTGEIERLPFPDNSFDVVTALNSIQFADDQRRALQEAKRVLKPGGTFLMGMWCEPQRCELSAVFRAVMPLMPPPPADREEPPTLSVRENLVALVESADFQVEGGEDVECVFQFENADHAWRGIRPAGNLVEAAAVLGEDRIREAVISAVSGFKAPSGGLSMSNWIRYVVAR